MTPIQAAKRVGYSLEELRLPNRKREIVNAREQFVKKLFKAGYRRAAIARILNRHWSSIEHLIHERKQYATPKPRKRWARNHDACLICDETTRKHWAHGTCTGCRDLWNYWNEPDVKDRKAKFSKQWRFTNSERKDAGDRAWQRANADKCREANIRCRIKRKARELAREFSI